MSVPAVTMHCNVTLAHSMHSPKCTHISIMSSADLSRQRVILDVDTGVDDAEAIMLAVAQPHLEVVAITCVSGNIDVQQVCSNTIRVLQVCDKLQVSNK